MESSARAPRWERTPHPVFPVPQMDRIEILTRLALILDRMERLAGSDPTDKEDLRQTVEELRRLREKCAPAAAGHAGPPGGAARSAPGRPGAILRSRPGCWWLVVVASEEIWLISESTRWQNRSSAIACKLRKIRQSDSLITRCMKDGIQPAPEQSVKAPVGFTQLRFRPAQRPRSGKHGVRPVAVR